MDATIPNSNYAMNPEWNQKWQKHNGMTQAEWLVYRKLTISTFNSVLRTGWPDFLVTNKSGKVFCVEVKCDDDKITEAQKIIHKILSDHGIPTMVVKDGWCEEFGVRFYRSKKRIRRQCSSVSPVADS